ncbi:excalibur calcium-binding domain-containing protein [Nonomuraea wenchangensis]|uniref:excalibur calcium-binding domain-containing protein n=1 Tax=Nonomuraea wenchangensis TaxID=568860 RepID=UPI0033DEFD19
MDQELADQLFLVALSSLISPSGRGASRLRWPPCRPGIANTCAEANVHGHGSYRLGVDEEYGWYQNRDGDGVVCEHR